MQEKWDITQLESLPATESDRGITNRNNSLFCTFSVVLFLHLEFCVQLDEI